MWWRATLLLTIACAPAPGARRAEVVRALEKADDVLLRTRPALVAGKYAQMAADPFSFYRGNLALFRADWEQGRTSRSGFVSNTLPVLALGDPHPENFGILIASDGSLALEPNDFDSADLAPFLFDVRRLACGLGVGVLMQKGDAERVAKVGTAAAQRYADTLQALASGAEPLRIDAPGTSLVLQDVFSRARRDLVGRTELVDFTEVDAGARHFKQGVLDPADPNELLAPVDAPTRNAVAEALLPLGPSERFEVLDVARIYGSGVASWPRVRLLVLVQGQTASVDDDVLLELKELTESPLAGWYALPTASDTPTRVEAALRRAWARPDADPLWYTTSWLGLPLQVRTKSNAHRSIRVARFTGARGTEPELQALASTLGELIARVHVKSDSAAVRSVVSQLSRDPAVFAQEQGAFAASCAQQVLDDHAEFKAALDTLGPTLGVTVDVTQPLPPLLRGPP